MVKADVAILQVTIYPRPNSTMEAIKELLSKCLSEKHYNGRIIPIVTPVEFSGTNCGCESTYNIVFNSTNSKIPEAKEVISLLENIDSDLFKLGFIEKDYRYFYRYI